MNNLINKINRWAISHGLDKGNPKIEWVKVTEEVGEIRDVFLKPRDFADPEWSLKDAIGDSIVTLIVLCLQLGYDVEECLTIAYNDIKDRKGVMIDDNFVKEKKRDNQLTIATVLLLVSLAINVTTVLRVVNRPIETVVIHKADNAVELHGKVTGKSMVGKLYTIDCGAYGKFLVSKEQYDQVNVGDDIPSYLKERGQ